MEKGRFGGDTIKIVGGVLFCDGGDHAGMDDSGTVSDKCQGRSWALN